jgi:hypothetical protein
MITWSVNKFQNYEIYVSQTMHTHITSFDIPGSCLCVALQISKQVNLGKERDCCKAKCWIWVELLKRRLLECDNVPKVAEPNVEYGWNYSRQLLESDNVPKERVEVELF